MPEKLTEKEQKDLKSSFLLEIDEACSTRIFAVVVSKHDHLNNHMTIPIPDGEPICEEVHDLVRDCYYVYGVSWKDLGEIPMSIWAVMPDVEGWQSQIPIPSSMLEQYFTPEQNQEFESWKKQHGDDYYIKFLQTRSVY